jgi:enoyl-[acyl-carrier protein] reductase III
MYSELNGKNVLVTGAARGFGRAIALRLASDGATIVVNFRRSKSDAQEVVEEIERLGAKAIALRGDVGDDDSLDRMFEGIKSELGSLDIVVSNAAFGVPGSVLDSTKRYWDITMSASARSLVSLAQRAVPLMPEKWGRLISITSEGGTRVLDGYGLVGAAKGALESLTRSLAVELAPRGILVNGIMAGVADTKSFRSIPGAEAMLQKAIDRTPVGRVVEPKDVADVVAFLCSDEARMICGQFIVVDGGLSILI